LRKGVGSGKKTAGYTGGDGSVGPAQRKRVELGKAM